MCVECNWEEWMETIQESLEDASELPEKAEDFVASVTEKLESIQQWVEENEHITDAQAGAVENMSEAIRRWLR